MKFKLGDIVWIRWEDHYHCYNAGWQNKKNRKELEIHKPLFCETVGFVVLDTKARIGLVPTYSDGQSNGGVAVKMKRCIVAHKVLKKAKGK